jgi:hypothetical protein
MNVDFSSFAEVEKFKEEYVGLKLYKKEFAMWTTYETLNVEVYFSWETDLSSSARMSPKWFANKKFDHYDNKLSNAIKREKERHESLIELFWDKLENFCIEHSIDSTTEFFLKVIEK